MQGKSCRFGEVSEPTAPTTTWIWRSCKAGAMRCVRCSMKNISLP